MFEKEETKYFVHYTCALLCDYFEVENYNTMKFRLLDGIKYDPSVEKKVIKNKY